MSVCVSIHIFDQSQLYIYVYMYICIYVYIFAALSRAHLGLYVFGNKALFSHCIEVVCVCVRACVRV
jgi:hypothetical protein